MFVNVNGFISKDSNYEIERFDFLLISFQSSLGKRKIFSKKKNMEAVKVKLEDILYVKKYQLTD